MKIAAIHCGVCGYSVCIKTTMDEVHFLFFAGRNYPNDPEGVSRKGSALDEH